MKRFLFAVTLLCAAACGPKMPANQQKAEAIVTEYLKKTLKYPATYKNIQFDTLREEHEPFITAEPEGRRLSALAAAFTDSSTAYKKKSDNELMTQKTPDMNKLIQYHKKDSLFIAKSDSVANIIQQKSKDYVGKKFQYVIGHTYKANNSLNRLTEYFTTYWINSDLTKIEHKQETR